MTEIIIDKTNRKRITYKRRLILIYLILLGTALITPFCSTHLKAKYTTSTYNPVTINVRNPNYTIVFHSNDDSGIDSTYNDQCTYGSNCTFTAFSVMGFQKAGYDFKWWNTVANDSGTSYTDAQTVTNLSSTDGAVIDLYAQWAPGFTVTGNPSTWTNQDVTLTVTPNGGDPVSSYEYSFDGGSNWQSLNNMVFSSNQDVHIRMRSSNGYYTSAEQIESITKVDKVVPTVTLDNSIEYAVDHSTNSVTTLIAYLGDSTSITTGVNTSDDLSDVASGWPKCYRNGTEISSTSAFTAVGRYAITCKVQDNAGNETTVSREVLIRWPLAGKYVVARTTTTEPNGYIGQCATGYTAPGIAGTGLSSTTSPNGLYRDNASTGANVGLPFASKYYYTGPTVENYITFAGRTFRILNVATNNAIKMLGDVSDEKVRWGASYETNNRKIYLSSIYNTWSTTWWPLGQIYNNVSGESKYLLFSNTEKAHLDLATFYAGRFKKSDAPDISYTVYYEQTGGVNLGGDDSPEFQGYSAFPNVSDYLKASKAHDYVINIDDTQDNGVLGIGTTKRDIFINNSWIDMSIDQWTMNSKNDTSTDNDYWVVDGTVGGRIVSRTFYYSQQYRPVFYLNNNTILSGVGTSDLPYNVEEDWAWFDSCQVVQ